MLEPGTRIAERYLVEDLLGQGGMGAVYRALDERDGARVAIKVAAAAGAATREFEARFLREARIGELLGQTPGFVRASDWGRFGEGDTFLYLALDLIDGAAPLDLRSGTAADRLERLSAASHLVAEAHRQGVIHRDLKPENFLQSPQGGLYLTDFGLAKLLGEHERDDPELLATLTQSLVGMGTPRYMAPEQFEDAKHVDARADVYSLGVMLFLALTGEWPFSGSTPIELIQRHQQVRRKAVPPPRPRDVNPVVPEALDALCAHALAIDPGRRVPTVADLCHALDDARPRRSPTTLPPPAAPPRRGNTLDMEVTAPELPLGLSPGSATREVVNEGDGSVLLWIPPGSFKRGHKGPEADPNEAPVHTVHVSQGFFLAKTPVTWSQYESYCDASGAPRPERKITSERGMTEAGSDHPVFGVSWDDARAYCEWAGARLPSEAEWELAARGGDRRLFPWGAERPAPERCNTLDHPRFGGRGTSPVQAFPSGASPFGCLDMLGNVWEWVDDIYAPYVRRIQTDPRGPEQGPLRVTRGGSWSTPAAQCRATTRRMLPPGLRANNLGFRLCRSAEGPP